MALFYIKTQFCQEEARVINDLSKLTPAFSLSCPSYSLIKIRFTVKRKSRSKHECVIRAAFGNDNPGFLVVASNPGLQYEIVVGYVELLHTRLSGGEGKRSLPSIWSERRTCKQAFLTHF